MRSRQVARLERILWLALMLTLSANAFGGGDFVIKQAQTRLDGEQFFLTTSIDFEFSDIALEALDNGVPLTIVLHIQVRRADAWLWEDSLMDQQLRYAIRYKPLSERYEVYRLPGDRGRSFVSREAAIAALRRPPADRALAPDRRDGL